MTIFRIRIDQRTKKYSEMQRKSTRILSEGQEMHLFSFRLIFPLTASENSGSSFVSRWFLASKEGRKRKNEKERRRNAREDREIFRSISHPRHIAYISPFIQLSFSYYLHWNSD